MKKLFILTLLFVFAASAYAQNDVLRGDTIDIIIIDPGGTPPEPHLSPIHNQDVWGVIRSNTQSLSIYVNSCIVFDRVRIYRNGQLAVSDDAPTPINNTLYYNLSALGSGFYSILLEADAGTVYQGYFILL